MCAASHTCDHPEEYVRYLGNVVGNIQIDCHVWLG